MMALREPFEGLLNSILHGTPLPPIFAEALTEDDLHHIEAVRASNKVDQTETLDSISSESGEISEALSLQSSGSVQNERVDGFDVVHDRQCEDCIVADDTNCEAYEEFIMHSAPFQVNGKPNPTVAVDECSYCHKKGHWKKNCPKLNGSSSRRGRGSGGPHGHRNRRFFGQRLSSNDFNFYGGETKAEAAELVRDYNNDQTVSSAYTELEDDHTNFYDNRLHETFVEVNNSEHEVHKESHVPSATCQIMQKPNSKVAVTKCFFCHEKGHLKKNCPNRGKSSSGRDEGRVQHGHMKRNISCKREWTPSRASRLTSSSSNSNQMKEENEEETLIIIQESNMDLNIPSPYSRQEDGIINAEADNRFQEALTEAWNLRTEGHKESLKGQRAEKDAIESHRKDKLSEDLCPKEVNRSNNIEESLAEDKFVVECLKQLLAEEELKVEFLKYQRDEMFDQMQLAKDQKQELELRITDSDNSNMILQKKLLETQSLLDKLNVEHETALKEVKEACQSKVVNASKRGSTKLSEFSISEIVLATNHFSESVKIGGSGYGSVYRGFLRNTSVAIKILNPESMQVQSEFHQEVNVLSRVRHPNLISLVGVCSEISALIYEYLPNGSLDDRLDCKNNTPPLTWQARTRIASEICTALIFLHSNKPHPIVHGDLRPENIFLDANLISKLGGFGISRLLVHSSTTCDELTPHCDVYSLGILILQLLTGKPAFGIDKMVREALNEKKLHELIDGNAGDWPFVQAKQLTHLALRCCANNRKSRPDLVGDVWRVLEPMRKAASSNVSSLSFGSVMDNNVLIPNHFICPIFQDIMRDPHVAADGFTYEAEALKGWFGSGHRTSPMTNLKLPNCDLIPNHSLRSTIQEWLQKHPQS